MANRPCSFSRCNRARLSAYAWCCMKNTMWTIAIQKTCESCSSRLPALGMYGVWPRRSVPAGMVRGQQLETRALTSTNAAENSWKHHGRTQRLKAPNEIVGPSLCWLVPPRHVHWPALPSAYGNRAFVKQANGLKSRITK